MPNDCFPWNTNQGKWYLAPTSKHQDPGNSLVKN